MTRKEAMEILEAVHKDLAYDVAVVDPAHWLKHQTAVMLVIASTLIEMQHES